MLEQINETFDLESGRNKRQGRNDSKQKEAIHEPEKKMPLEVKIIWYGGSAILLLWASGYILDALAGAVKGYKNLKRSVLEK